MTIAEYYAVKCTHKYTTM